MGTDRVHGFDPTLPLERAWTPPSSWYVDPAFLAREARTTWRDNWVAVARADQVREPGDFVSGRLLDESWVVLRDAGGELRGFHNVCRHHAAPLVEGAGRAERLTCPYHGWTWELDGRFRSAPRAGSLADFDPTAFGLAPLAARVWGPLVLVHLGRRPRDLEAELGELGRRLAALGTDRLSFAERRRYELECNWKVFVDNYLDGGYHVPELHRGLAGELDLASYRIELFERSSIQSCEAAVDVGEGRVAGRALYAWLHPGLMLNRYGPVLDTNLVLPLGPQRCEVLVDFWFDPAAEPAFVARSLEASERIQREDMEIGARVQVGLRSSSYERGRYAPAREGAAHHFHRLLAEELARTL